jgi:predicted  nucleic acid-binding Zn-ribbon protein
MDLAARVAHLESDVTDIKRDVGDLKRETTSLGADLAELRKEFNEFRLKVTADLADIRGRLTNMPTTFQVLTWYVGVAIGLTGLVYAIARITAAG